jgi:hypothetical protein
VIDFMPLRDGGAPQLVRIVEGVHGEVPMRMQFVARLDYGFSLMWFPSYRDAPAVEDPDSAGVRLVERFELDAPLKRWKQIRARIHKQVLDKGYDPKRNTFTQYYGSQELDAAVLMIPIVGFLFWLVTALAMNGRSDEAREPVERLLSLGNDLGLFSGEYDVAHERLVGNFPQAFTHLTLVVAAKTLANPTAGVAHSIRGSAT